MFARVLRSQFRVNKVAEASKLFQESVVPLCRKQKGFKGAYFMSDARTGEAIIITLWESEEAMLASEESHFFQDQVAKFVPFYAKPPIREAYEIAVVAEMKKG